MNTQSMNFQGSAGYTRLFQKKLKPIIPIINSLLNTKPMKQEKSFTPTPWKIHFDTGEIFAGEEELTLIADFRCVTSPGKVWEANANLIAASPDQNAALKKGLYHSETLRMLLTIPDSDLDRDIQEMKDALNKANP